MELSLARSFARPGVDFSVPLTSTHGFQIQISQCPLASLVPVEGTTVFTDGSGHTHKAVVTWQDDKQWHELVAKELRSPQQVELCAVILAFQQFATEPVNAVTDSAYVTNIVRRISNSLLREVSDESL
ncbi:hypothetical protein WISP_01697 [Willisornis vidua]|uniref:RNase H type-1 domain-containing protein n=1 Tax=Willisornis vidua TaxID=1566151 RepID=A0ABQ9DZJ8_9PASS|nr:hypothetical protein WISP_01697 [Willisornis vidua]